MSRFRKTGTICLGLLTFIFAALLGHAHVPYVISSGSNTGAIGMYKNNMLKGVYDAAPTISSFSPTSGAAGTTVTINGSHFGLTPAENIVHFGAMKAVVLSASATRLTVSVPVSATEVPITVTVNRMTASARTPFDLTFTDQHQAFDASSFAAEQFISTTINPLGLAVADFDEDGKPDLATGFNNGNYVPALTVYRNQSIDSTIQLTVNGEYTAFPSDATWTIVPTDLDGDGKLDIAASTGETVLGGMFRNISTPGHCALAAQRIVNYGNISPAPMSTADFDGDGRPDFALGSYLNVVSVYRNISSDTNIVYVPAVQYQVSGFSVIDIQSADFDGDGKPDIVARLQGSVMVFLNTSTISNISFAAPQTFVVPYGSSDARLTVSDLNQDGKPDILAIPASSANLLSVLQNNSSPGNLSFADRIDFPTKAFPMRFVAADLNGDGLPDVAIKTGVDSTLVIYQNTSSKTAISFAAPYSIRMSRYEVGDMAAADLDGDGRQELLMANNISNNVGIFRNRLTNGLRPMITSFSPTSGRKGDAITIIGTHLTGTVSVNIGHTVVDTILSVQDNTVRIILGNGGTGNVQLSTASGTDSLAGFIYLGAKLNSFSPDSLAQGGTLLIHGVGLSAVTKVTLGGIPAGSFSIQGDTLIHATVGTGGSGYVAAFAGTTNDSLPEFVFLPPRLHVLSFTPRAGLTGTVISISGNHFGGASSVSFGGTLASGFTVVSDSLIQATVANGSSGSVRVVSPLGDDSVSGFTYLLHAPIVTSFTPDSGSNGTAVIINGKYFTTADTVSFGNTPAISFQVLSDSVISAVVGTGSSGQVAVFTPHGRSAKSGFVYVVTPVIYYFAPVAATSGTVVRIVGARLSSITTVSFGNVAATEFTIMSDSVIYATVGSGATGSVAADGPDGNASLAGFSFIDVANPLPVMLSYLPRAAAQGDTVLITGRNFSTVRAVDFGSVAAASFRIVNDTLIVAVVGSGASGNVEVANEAGTAQLAGFYWIPPPVGQPVIFSFSPTSGKYGDSITIRGQALLNPRSVGFGGAPAVSFGALSDSIIVAYVGHGATGSVTVGTGPGIASLPGFTYTGPPDPVRILAFSPTSARTGTTIKIFGGKFNGVTGVLFGGYPASAFRIVDDSLLTAVVGAGGSGDVTILLTADTAFLAGFTFIKDSVQPAIAVLGFDPIAGMTGTQLTISGHGFATATAVLFGGVAAESFIVQSDSLITAIVGAGATGDVTVTTPAGQASKNGFSFITRPSGLPFKLLSFSGTSSDNTVQLQWQAIHDESLSHYLIERSEDTLHWTTVILIQPPSDSVLHAYSYTDTLPRYTGIYYRLEIVDSTQQSTFSNIVFIPLEKKTMNIYPNPAHGYVIDEHPASSTTSYINITDVMGKLIKSVPVSPNTLVTRIDLSGIPPGMYQMSWIDGSTVITKTILLE